MSTTTTTTTEISSNSNSSCRLLVCLSSLPFHDQRVFRSLLGHIDFLRLSACCRSLRNSIRNDRLLWQALYHRDFLLGPYYTKEMDFVLWCVRTDINNPCTSDKRADLLENVDWYNVYRRRVSTENNWRFGRCRTLHIDMEYDEGQLTCYSDFRNERIYTTKLDRSDVTSRLRRNYALEYLPHSNLRSNNNIVYDNTFSASANFLPLDNDSEKQHKYVTGDHYIAVSPDPIESNTNYNVEILSRGSGSIFTTFDVPVQYEVKTIEGKWALLVHELKKSNLSLSIFEVMVFDIDNSVMCPGSTGGVWNTICFYKTTNDTAIVYTARRVNDDTNRIEWALYQFSNNNPVVQLRSGWFELPEEITHIWLNAYNSYDSHIIIQLDGYPAYYSCIIHSVASSGQSHIPRNCYEMSRHQAPISLLRAGYNHGSSSSRLGKVWTDLSYYDDQVLRMPRTASIGNIIGDIYAFTIKRTNHTYKRLFVDISTKKTIRKLELPEMNLSSDNCAMVGMIRRSYDRQALVIEEYGEL